MKGKDKCRILKEIRQQIAEKNDIAWTVSECSHKGECRGTCPKCESEVRKLERELEIRRKLGKAVAITGVSAACMAGLTACSMEEVVDCAENFAEEVRTLINRGKTVYEPDDPGGEQPFILEGDVPYIPEPEEELMGFIEPYYEEVDVIESPDDVDVNENTDDVEDIKIYGNIDEPETCIEIYVTDGEIPFEEDW